MIDAYLYGMVSHSTVYLLRKDFRFPHANSYAEIERSMPSIGGEAANSAAVLARFGLATRLDGNWLNPAHAGAMTGLLGSIGVDTSRLSLRDGFGTDEVLISDGESRTVFGTYAAFSTGPRQWNEPSEEDITSAAIVSIDPYFRAESEAAARLCVKHGKPYVTVDCRYESFLAQNAASTVISHELRDSAYPGADMREVFSRYQSSCAGLTIFTFGEKELWYARPGQKMKTFTPYRITAVDTTGAGDSFRAGIVYGLLKGWDDARTVAFASAVAACVCLTVPHALNCPGLDKVLGFMEQNGGPAA